MRRSVGSMPLLVVGYLLFAGASVALHGDDLGASVNQQLGQARAATARDHDVDEAITDGYVDMGVNPGEGDAIEFVNFGLLDCTLDLTHPEALRYVASENGLRLMGVEYAIPMACSDAPPADFLPGAGEWEPEPGVPVWKLAVSIWSGNPDDTLGGSR